MKIDVNTLAQFKRHLQEKNSVENKNDVEKYLIDGCENPNDDKSNILDWQNGNALKYKIYFMIAQHVLTIPASTDDSKSTFNTGSRVLN